MEDIIRVKSGESLNVRELQSKDRFPIYGGNGINGYYDKYNVERDTIIIGRVGFYCGSIHKTKSESWVTDNALIVDSYPTNIDTDWLYLTLIWSNLRKTSNSTAQPVVSGKSIYPIYVPLPPKSEQHRIVNTFDVFINAIGIIEIGKNSIQDLIQLTKSKILDLAMQGKLVPQDPADESAAEMLRRINPKAKIITDNPHYPQLPKNWVLTTINSVCLYGNGKTIPVSDINAEDWVLELEDMEGYTGRLLQIKRKKDRAISGARHSFKSGDILFSRLRTYLNKVLLSTKDGFCSTEMIPITPFKCIISEYLYYWLRSPFFVEYAISCGYGVKMPRLSTYDANKAIVPLPPLEEQYRIVTTIKSVEEIFDHIVFSLT